MSRYCDSWPADVNRCTDWGWSHRRYDRVNLVIDKQTPSSGGSLPPHFPSAVLAFWSLRITLYKSSFSCVFFLTHPLQFHSYWVWCIFIPIPSISSTQRSHRNLFPSHHPSTFVPQCLTYWGCLPVHERKVNVLSKNILNFLVYLPCDSAICVISVLLDVKRSCVFP